MGSNMIGINDSGIDTLIYEINDYSIRVRNIFNEIESLVDETNSFYDCSSATVYRSNFNSFKENFPIMVNNILSYKRDLQKLKINFSKEHGVLSDFVSEEAKRIQSQNIK